MNAVFVTAATPTPLVEAEELVRTHFGITGAARPLASERDQNFHIAAQGGSEYVLKITNPAEAPDVSDLQTQVLETIAAAAPALPVPRIIRTRDGRTEARPVLSDGSIRTVRLVTCLPGEPLHKFPPTRSQHQSLGRCIAALAIALADLVHPAASHALLWDLSAAGQVRGFLRHVPDANDRVLVAHFVDRFERDVLPMLPALPRQVIHNDINRHNVLVDPEDSARIIGIIDFGDAILAPRINDVAVAASYNLAHGVDPIATAGDLLVAYHACNPLQGREIALLPDLIGARLAMTVAITHWRASLHPDNRDYILRNNPAARAGLAALAAVRPAEAQERLRSLCFIG